MVYYQRRSLMSTQIQIGNFTYKKIKTVCHFLAEIQRRYLQIPFQTLNNRPHTNDGSKHNEQARTFFTSTYQSSNRRFKAEE